MNNPPGHPQAVIDGCTCPVLDNAHGKGCGYTDDDGHPLYIFNGDCVLHGDAPLLDPDTVCFKVGE